MDRLINEGIPQLKDDIAQWKGNWLYIGEWSVAVQQPVTDTKKYREFIRLYFDALRGAHAGYTYWTWKVDED